MSRLDKFTSVFNVTYCAFKILPELEIQINKLRMKINKETERRAKLAERYAKIQEAAQVDTVIINTAEISEDKVPTMCEIDAQNRGVVCKECNDN